MRCPICGTEFRRQSASTSDRLTCPQCGQCDSFDEAPAANRPRRRKIPLPLFLIVSIALGAGGLAAIAAYALITGFTRSADDPAAQANSSANLLAWPAIGALNPGLAPAQDRPAEAGEQPPPLLQALAPGPRPKLAKADLLKVKDDMSAEQVIAILGKPTHRFNPTQLGGPFGELFRSLNMEHLTWTDDHTYLALVQLINDKVRSRAWQRGEVGRDGLFHATGRERVREPGTPPLTKDMVTKLQRGMTAKKVLELLGPPDVESSGPSFKDLAKMFPNAAGKAEQDLGPMNDLMGPMKIMTWDTDDGHVIQAQFLNAQLVGAVAARRPSGRW
ncbi:MAG: hypothetical protein ACJ8F7_19185 [Gemmataceae bacterium]